MPEDKDSGFTIRDRRGFAGETAGGAGEQKEAKGPAPEAPPKEEQQESGPLHPLDFATFILSLATTAQVGLGLVPDPQSKVVTQNLSLAKQMIDLIGILKEKTKGNLGKEEQELLDSVLTGLRMTYVKVLEGEK